MGILRSREEFLPVTCAILKPEDREAFFNSIKKQPHSRPDSIAKLCEVETDAVNDWINGKTNVPYHYLQMLAHHFGVTMPPVGELRREYVQVTTTATRREMPPKLPPKPQERKERGGGREGGREGRREAKPKAEKPRREERPRRERQPRPERKPKAQQPQRQQEKRPHPPKGPRVPEPSEQLAYWVGVAIMTTRREETALVMTADRRIGQNFAGTWANITRDLFGVKPALAMVDNGRAQEARLPAAGFEEFLDRLELKAGKKPGEAGVPRWAWSNPAWKGACVKGIVDASAHFQRAPALVIQGLPERLAAAVRKMLEALEIKAEAGADGSLALRGGETLDRYFEKVGTTNMKLKDQYRAFKHPRGGGQARPETGDAPAERGQLGPGTLETEGSTEKDEQRVLGEEIEAADEEAKHAEEEAALQAMGMEAGPDEGIEAAIDAAAAAKAAASDQPSRFGDPPPQPHKPKPQSRRRTVFRGRPGKR